MIKEEKKRPAIRFEGFENDWERRKVGEFLTISKILGHTGLDAKKLTVKLWGKGIVSKSDAFKGSENTQYYIRHAGQFMYGKLDFLHAAFGIVPDNLDGYESTLDSPAFDIHDMDSHFLLERVLQRSFYLYNGIIANGSRKAKRIHENLFLDMTLLAPDYLEQKKVGDVFRNIGNVIDLHQRKLEQVQTLKKYFLQNMFPAEGETVPKIRFKGFTGDWEQRKVLDLLDLLTDFDANGSFADMAKNVNTFDGNGFAWYVRMTDLDNPKPLDELKYVDKPSYDFLRKTHLHGGELLMAKRGNIGKIYIFEPRTEYATVAPNMYLLKLNTKVVPRFLYNFFLSDEGKRQLLRLNASTTMGALYKDDVKNIDVIIPPIEEQRKIAEYFAYLDNLITLHQRKLDQLQSLKKFMLQNLFA
ncbi:restriction endonuclease subunit S [Megasphaera sp. DISK 18]|uniref:restriction endonuclease subunit S n=1 Tax=Megasphaera sp. DISK 18 TaxID=1776081 RepID=UPI000807121C|nr:restriction endonuclease subunit S [Megasphaera sp. DISK 18]OBZ33916.1 hypothetical protein A0U42_04220 [Megasphaera sp. DISK 18]